jgi:hypothetical protein
MLIMERLNPAIVVGTGVKGQDIENYQNGFQFYPTKDLKKLWVGLNIKIRYIV